MLFSGCTKSSSDSSENAPNPPSSGNTQNFRSDCGTVLDGNVRNPPSADQGIPVTVTKVANHNTLIISRAGGSQLVRLRGLKDDIPSFKKTSAIQKLSSLLGSATLFTDECQTTVIGGGKGIVGELFSASGISYTESVISAGAAEILLNGSCGESLVSSCYVALNEEAATITGAAVRNFLWKPVSERDGNLVVLLSPRADVFINGEMLTDTGPSNGRATTARAGRSGCSYGANATVEAYDSQGRPLVFPGGATTFTIANGCSRIEFD